MLARRGIAGAAQRRHETAKGPSPVSRGREVLDDGALEEPLDVGKHRRCLLEAGFPEFVNLVGGAGVVRLRYVHEH